MGTTIVRHKQWFFLWSNNSDELASDAMTQAEMEDLLLEEIIEDGKREITMRMERVLRTGTSSRMDANAEDTCIQHLYTDNMTEEEEENAPIRPFLDILREAGVPEEDL